MASGSNPNLKVEEKYTKAEIEAMADKCFKRCDRCFRYEPVRQLLPDFMQSGQTSKDAPLFKFCKNGCYYAKEFPWNSSPQWCVFWGVQDHSDDPIELEAQHVYSEHLKRIYDTLCALTKDNLKTNTK